MELIIRDGRRLVPVEIKSSATFNEEFVKGISNFKLVVGEKSNPGIVFYNGDRSFSFHDTIVLNPLLHADKLP